VDDDTGVYVNLNTRALAALGVSLEPGDGSVTG
jgi:hypothetical protein